MTWLGANLDWIGQLALRHVLIAAPAILLSLLLAVPLARLTHRRRTGRALMRGLTGVIYPLPSLAAFILLPGILGTRILDPLNVVIALTLYGTALLVRTATEAFDAVDDDARQAALAMGHSPGQMFRRVELPLAGGGIVAGLRVVSASTLSLVSVGALIGVQSLGTLFTEGYQRAFLLEIGAGIAAIVVLAVVFDLIIQLVARLLMPWTRHAGARGGTGARLALRTASRPGAVPRTASTAAPAGAEQEAAR